MTSGLANHRQPTGPRERRVCTRDRRIEFAVDSNLSGKLVTSAEHAVTPSGALVSVVETNEHTQLEAVVDVRRYRRMGLYYCPRMRTRSS
jgi:hypothetical protein